MRFATVCFVDTILRCSIVMEKEEHMRKVSCFCVAIIWLCDASGAATVQDSSVVFSQWLRPSLLL